jgi:hypothetical protein
VWITTKIEDVEIKYSYEPHQFVKLYKSIPWLVCKSCGMVLLRNDFTRWCNKMGCLNEYHPGYKNAMRK